MENKIKEAGGSKKMWVEGDEKLLVELNAKLAKLKIKKGGNKELSAEEWDRSVIGLAHRQLIIEECRKCRHPKVKDFCCSFCGDDNA